jgi:hypothetical protein
LLRPQSETLVDVTDRDLDELSDMEDHPQNKALPDDSENTLVDEKIEVQMRIKKRETRIDRKFQRLSSEISDDDFEGSDGNGFAKVAMGISKEEEDAAANSFEKVMHDNFLEDKSEDWLTQGSQGSETTPEKEVAVDILGTPDNDKSSQSKFSKGKCRIINVDIVGT